MAGRNWFVLSLAFGLVIAACADGGSGTNRDGGRGGSGEGGIDAGPGCATDDECPDDGIMCNGILICRDGACVASGIPTCNDGVGCTRDTCATATDECQNIPDDSACPDTLSCFRGVGCSDAPACEFDSDCGSDGVYCNGDEVCVEGRCRSPGTRSCAGADSCAMNECVEGMGACVSTAYPDILTNVMHCGTGANDCIVCPEPAPALNQVASCTDGACGVACAAGFSDRDGNPANGCEYACTVMPGLDVPDDLFVDANCDGIDGDRALAIFVSTLGIDANDGLTSSTPVASFGRAFDVFASNPTRNQIVVANGTYTTATALNLPDGVGIYGGYASDFASRTDSRAQLTASSSTALRAIALSMPTRIDRINVSTADATSPGGSTVTLVIINSSDHLTLRFVNVIAGRGGSGVTGATGATGAAGNVGSAASANSTVGAPGAASGGSRGGHGVYRGVGQPGLQGLANGSSCGGAPGPGGPFSGPGGMGCNDGDPQALAPGGRGGDGCMGSMGGHGAAGSGTGGMNGTGMWSPIDGTAGTAGGTGGGGGGGGAGGGENCSTFIVDYFGTGRGGGGGGGGGTGGGGGMPGGSGGASIAVYLASSTLVAQQLRLQTSGGGNGGAGGGGGPGGVGRGGGAGASSSDDKAGPGGQGGSGGPGGVGGCGGGGGGGPSIAVWGTGASSQVQEITPVSFVTGAGGTGGSSCGNSGPSGVSQNLRDAFIL